MIDKLRDYGIEENLLKDLEHFRKFYKLDPDVEDRVSPPKNFYYGKKVWTQALYALLNEQNLLLVGHKATGKNILADNLAYAFRRPKWTVSFHNYLGADDLIGLDTYRDGQVVFREGPITSSALYGGFGILDEINMARNDALSVLYSALDYRRVLDVPGHRRYELDDATRFIATINYGYAGTKELNEALVSRFAVVQMPDMSAELISEILKGNYPDIDDDLLKILADFYMSLQEKAENGEISSRPVDLRGLIAAIRLYRSGMGLKDALEITIVNKVFDPYENQLVQDLMDIKIPEEY